MPRPLFALALLTLLPAASRGQDIPLFDVLIDGEGWKKQVDDGKTRAATLAVFGSNQVGDDAPSGFERSPDGGTMYMSYSRKAAVWAYRVEKDRTPTAAAPYCPLRLKPGQTHLAVTGLAVDPAGRLYAATADGVQFFDPTGRFSGMIALPPGGTPTQLQFEGSTLVARTGGTTWTRKLRGTGAK